MRYWLLMSFLFLSVLFHSVQKVSDAKATRPVKYEVIETEFHDSVTWIKMIDSLNNKK